jgi:tRNA (guanine37-N1)-methyltransferase
MRFDIVTLFPDLFEPHLRQGITRRAFEGGRLQVRLWPLRDFATDAYRRVDDRPFGGGPGMVMLAEPLERAIAAVLAERGSGVPVVHFTPAGRRLDQPMVREFATGDGAVLLCGRYEGIDQRVIDRHVTHEISIGDVVLSGGELPALVLLDAVARLQPDVLRTASHEQDSFSDGLLEGPAYSRPRRRAPGRRRRSLPADAQPIIVGFAVLCRVLSIRQPPSRTTAGAHHGPDPDPRAGRDRPPGQEAA